MREILTQYWLPSDASRPLQKTWSGVVRIQHLVSVDTVRHGRCPTHTVCVCMADRPCGTEPCYRFSVWLLGTPTLLNCILTSALKLNSRVRSRHIIVPPPLVCNNMNADGASRDRSSNTYESLD